MSKITEIIPDDIPQWAKEAMANGNLFAECIRRAEQSATGQCEWVSVEDAKLLLSFAPKDCPKGLGPTFYHTLSYEGDKELQVRIDRIREAVEQADDNG